MSKTRRSSSISDNGSDTGYVVGAEVECKFDDQQWYKGKITEFRRDKAVIDFEDGDRVTMKLPDPDVRLYGNRRERKQVQRLGYSELGGTDGAAEDLAELGYLEGCQVKCKFDEGWFLGTITELHGAKAVIDFEDGDRQRIKLPDPDVKLVGDAPEKSSAAKNGKAADVAQEPDAEEEEEEEDLDAYVVGAEVECKFDDGKWYRGKITRFQSNKAVIDFEDGDRDRIQLPDPEVRLVQPKTTAKSPAKEAEVESSKIREQYEIGTEVEVIFDDKKWYRGLIADYSRGDKAVIDFEDGDRLRIKLPDPDVRLAKGTGRGGGGRRASTAGARLKNEMKGQYAGSGRYSWPAAKDGRRDSTGQRSEGASRGRGKVGSGRGGEKEEDDLEGFFEGANVECRFDDGKLYRGVIRRLRRRDATIEFKDGDRQRITLPDPDVKSLETGKAKEAAKPAAKRTAEKKREQEKEVAPTRKAGVRGGGGGRPPPRKRVRDDEEAGTEGEGAKGESKDKEEEEEVAAADEEAEEEAAEDEPAAAAAAVQEEEEQPKEDDKDRGDDDDDVPAGLEEVTKEEAEKAEEDKEEGKESAADEQEEEEYVVGTEIEVIFEDNRWYPGQIIRFEEGKAVILLDDGDMLRVQLPDPDVRLLRQGKEGEGGEGDRAAAGGDKGGLQDRKEDQERGGARAREGGDHDEGALGRVSQAAAMRAVVSPNGGAAGERYCVGAEVEAKFDDAWFRGTISKYNRGNATIDFEDGDRRNIKLPDPDVRLVKKAKTAEDEQDRDEKMEDGG